MTNTHVRRMIDWYIYSHFAHGGIMMTIQKIAAIHDITGIGRCGLSVAMPLLSALGHQVCPLPTAVLSTHPGGFNNLYMRPLTADTDAILAHWTQEHITFDALYTGFLCTPAQADCITEAVTRMEPGFVLVDPVLGDHGKLYSLADDNMVAAMRSLAAAADLITPNLTEAFALLGEPYRGGIFSLADAEAIAEALAVQFQADCILKGVPLDENGHMTNLLHLHNSRRTITAAYTAVPQGYPGTGDAFASLLLGIMLHTRDLEHAFRTATRVTTELVLHTYKKRTPPREGVLLEDFCPHLHTHCGCPVD